MDSKKVEANILIVDDDPAVLGTARIYLKQQFTHIQATTNPGLIPELMYEHNVDVVLLDMNYRRGEIDGKEGFGWLAKIHEIDRDVQVICMTAYGEIDIAVKAIKAGASDFVIKPWENEKLFSTIQSALKLRKSTREVDKLRNTQRKLTEDVYEEFKHIIGNSLPMQKVFKTIQKVADTDANVLILGENGTGKELVARAIHAHSARGEKVIIRVDLGVLNENLLESELFGHVRGAFTDARDDKYGRFELASGGSLFLDEIGNLSPPSQAKLLTAIQNGQVSRLGSNAIIDVDIRLICATNMPLYQMVEEGSFRQDLLYRINTVEVQLPPLRQRKEDIPDLLAHYLSIYRRKYNKPTLRFNKSDIKKLQRYTWPGNVRELQHSVERMVIMAEYDQLDVRDVLHDSTAVPTFQAENFNLLDNEKALILRALEKNNGNVTQTARDLGIDRLALYRRFNKFGI